MYSFELIKPGQTAIFKKFFEEVYTGKNLHDLTLILKLVLPKDEHESLMSSIYNIKDRYANKFTSISIDEIFSIAGF